MSRLGRPLLVVLAAGAAAAAAFVVGTPAATGFTQEGVSFGFGSVIPMGHEWITRFAALELLGKDPVIPPDPDDPRKNWTHGKAKNTDLSSPGARAEIQRILGKPTRENTYASTFTPVLDAILGERWVDIGGFNVTNSVLGPHNCFDAVAQEPVDIQYDHFMRRYDDRDVKGGNRAATESQARFLQYFVAAATAPPGIITTWDGGGRAAKVVVDRNYYLFGRAVHLFEDSFSTEHTVRAPEKNFEQVLAIKSYLCASGAEQHSHGNGPVLNYTSGDVVWLPGTRFLPGWTSYKPSFMKVSALVATEATKDLWAAFIRTMGTPMATRAMVAANEASTLIANWLSLDPRSPTWYDDPAHRDATYVLAQGQTGKGRTVAACMKDQGVASGDQMAKVRELEATQRLCIYNLQPIAGFSDAVDPSLRIPFFWEWKSGSWLTPPSDWKIPETPVPPEVKVRIKSLQNGQYLTASDGVDHNQWIYAKAGTPLDWIQVGPADNASYRLASAPLFLSYNNTTGAVKLWQTAEHAQYRRQAAATGESIFSTYWDQYMWLSKESPYITRTGNPKNRDAQWGFERVAPAK
jgi:hypothetical protein